MNRLKQLYEEKIAPELVKELKLSNVKAVPKIVKIKVNAGVGSFRENREALDLFLEEMANFTGQKPQVRTARLSEAGFKIRKGDVVGISVTLRRDRMWAFLDKFISIVLPRVRDFRGLSPKSFDMAGNYSVGITDHTVFPEVDANKTKGIRHLQVTIVTNTKNLDESKALLTKLGMPFIKD